MTSTVPSIPTSGRNSQRLNYLAETNVSDGVLQRTVVSRDDEIGRHV
ncbi:hypothetical protein HSB1_36460 [Halogranum salarium B-1]|uniref:Uncharacterized protein n=1 Tax=Halogranum salarium B-1 TaxID=1210908 RepID=J3JEC0_9EURY|nr:hypothetical protein HSB1_36460 [Halogranum salarium B-1]